MGYTHQRIYRGAHIQVFGHDILQVIRDGRDRSFLWHAKGDKASLSGE